ncbi:hypothetical protein [Sutcliffiella halmapala]|uniref:hypothetical protein n=1 Tax=Sutcliffiella halmapala TaxID=79882 RepID=UPI0009959532|nr:hypothetical protein [Sutcliffiella halmapala]
MSSKTKKEEELLIEQEESFSIDKMITYFLIACALIIAVLTFFVFSDGFSVRQEEKISTYIASADELLKEAEQLTEPLSMYASGENNTIAIEEELVTLRQLISDGEALNAPKEFSAHHEIVKAIIVERYAVVYTYFLGERSRKIAETKFAEIEKLLEKENTSLLAALDEAGLNYEVLEDGNIRFFYKSY